LFWCRTTSYRKLKTQTSRRQVPLLFSLSTIEKDILNRWASELESMFGDDLSVPIFFEDRTSDTMMDIGILKKRIISALKIVTGNPDINLHHARHSAARSPHGID